MFGGRVAGHHSDSVHFGQDVCVPRAREDAHGTCRVVLFDRRRLRRARCRSVASALYAGVRRGGGEARRSSWERVDVRDASRRARSLTWGSASRGGCTLRTGRIRVECASCAPAAAGGAGGGQPANPERGGAAVQRRSCAVGDVLRARAAPPQPCATPRWRTPATQDSFRDVGARHRTSRNVLPVIAEVVAVGHRWTWWTKTVWTWWSGDWWWRAVGRASRMSGVEAAAASDLRSELQRVVDDLSRRTTRSASTSAAAPAVIAAMGDAGGAPTLLQLCVRESSVAAQVARPSRRTPSWNG